MKLKLILIFLIVLLQISCSKWLNLLPPEGLTRAEFWKTKEDVKASVMGAYASLASMDDLLFKYGEFRTDMVKGGNNQPLDEQKIAAGNIYPDNTLCNWSSFYKLINYCNEVISNAPIVKTKDITFTDYQLKSYLSEVYFLRSLSYFYLVRIFKDVPFVTEPTESDNVNIYLPKTNGDTILAHIVNDLKQVRNYAPNDYPTIWESKGRATKSAIDALLADISLWTFDYNSCITYCENIEAANRYKLMERDQFFELFFPGNSLESIFELQYSDNLLQKNHMYGLTNFNAYNYLPSDFAVQLFTLPPQIIRGPGSMAVNKSVYYIWKYAGMSNDGISVRPSFLQNSCDWIVYRYADILLMKAEALSQLGRYPEADAYLHQITFRANAKDYPKHSNAYDYETDIMNERALEFAFEGKRWFDLLRMGRRNNYNRKLQLIEILVKNASSSQQSILAIKLANPLGWYLPIYKLEVERNLNLVQNPYYNVGL